MDHAVWIRQPSRFRFLLGMAQMLGAVFSLTLVLETGLNALSLGAVIATGVLTGVSRALFRNDAVP